MNQATRLCRMCSSDIGDRHPNARYCGRSCKDSWLWRQANPIRESRFCAWCESDMAGKKAHALYCSRSCKSKAAEKRLRTGTEADKLRNRARYTKERAKRQAHARNQYWSNRDTYVSRSREWRKANPERRKIQHENRRARKFGNPGYVVVKARDWEKIRNRFSGCCAYCGAKPDVICMDHVVPLSRGGRHSPSNILPACSSCNSSKGALFVAEWRLVRNR